MKYFYARVSTKEQSLERQLKVAEGCSVDRVFADKRSGKDFDREAYREMKSLLKSGDEVYVKELDRLGRNKEGIKEEIKWFRDRGVILRILDIPTTMMDFGDQRWIADMVNNILVEVLGAVAEQERQKTKNRQREGIAAMKVINGKKISEKTGRAYGRPGMDKGEFEKYLKKQKTGEASVTECCRELGISRVTWYNWLKETA